MNHILFSPYGEITYYKDNVPFRSKSLDVNGDLDSEYFFTDANSTVFKFHREDGPALIYSNVVKFSWRGKIYIGYKFYFFNGEKLNCETDEEFGELPPPKGGGFEGSLSSPD